MPMHAKPSAPQRNPNQENSSMKTDDLYVIGNALVDAEWEVSDAPLRTMGVAKRHMTLIDVARRAELLGHLAGSTARRTGGGSVGNTVVALAQLKGRAFYSCRVADDELGAFYTQDLIANGVATNLTRSTPAPGQTGSCMVMVTSDAERSMSTFLGATAELDHTALHQQDIANSKLCSVTHGDSQSRAAWLANQAAGQVVSQNGNRLTREIPGLVNPESHGSCMALAAMAVESTAC